MNIGASLHSFGNRTFESFFGRPEISAVGVSEFENAIDSVMRERHPRSGRTYIFLIAPLSMVALGLLAHSIEAGLTVAGAWYILASVAEAIENASRRAKIRKELYLWLFTLKATADGSELSFDACQLLRGQSVDDLSRAWARLMTSQAQHQSDHSTRPPNDR
jgi:hypothetical protein